MVLFPLAYSTHLSLHLSSLLFPALLSSLTRRTGQLGQLKRQLSEKKVSPKVSP